MGSVFANQISFGEEELGPKGQGHVKALHIVCKCRGYVLSRVMIDNGLALNVCPLSTLQQMKLDLSHVRSSKTAVRAFDGTRRDVFGEVDLPPGNRPVHLQRDFQSHGDPRGLQPSVGRP